MYPDVFKGKFMCSFKCNKNLGHYVVSAKLKKGQSMEDQFHLLLQVIGHQIQPRVAFCHGPDQHSSAEFLI